MTKNEPAIKSEWENDEVKVIIPYSAAGISNTVVLYSKFTGKMMLLDVGDGSTRDLLDLYGDKIVNEVDVIAISHGHFDHMGGLYTLLGYMRMMGRSLPLNILIPKGCKEVEEIVSFFRSNYRESLPFDLWFHELFDGSGFDTDFFKTRAFEVKHYGLENVTEDDIFMPALGYRIRIGQTIVAYSGDTRYCESLETGVRDADIAIIEATHDELPETSRRVHLCRDEAIKAGSLAKDYILIHGIPGYQ
ncbi:MAG: MBL fold metallo-hydrolase [Candidatus Lokiarchaeota archaeon]|nr:MBL fold metallo-hydrolase [Candidatus Lokiarchaeota archaeon]